MIQSSTCNPDTRSNSPVLCVMTVRPLDRACAAISISYGPMSCPFLSSVPRILPAVRESSAVNGRISKGARKSASCCLVLSLQRLFSEPYSSSNVIGRQAGVEKQKRIGQRVNLRIGSLLYYELTKNT